MQIIHPIRLIVLGGLMALFGFVASFAMVLRVVEATFLLSFVAYISSFMGVFLGIIGSVEHSSDRNWRD